jgi:signal transduction histidine kinase
VYSIAQQDGLGLSVESEPSKGAAFTLVLPVDSVVSPVRETHSAKTQNPP